MALKCAGTLKKDSNQRTCEVGPVLIVVGIKRKKRKIPKKKRGKEREKDFLRFIM